jgi:hypothetical protein
MPRNPINYSKTYIYKLVSKDPTITDIYVGHTTDLTTRKNKHKSTCNNPNGERYNLYIYQFIRENGGWENWEMIIIECINCIDGNEARTHERRWFDILGATLNNRVPSRNKYDYYENNKDVINETRKQKYKQNKDIICEKATQYYEQNKEKRKQYYEQNKDEINRKQRERRALKKLQSNTENINKIENNT